MTEAASRTLTEPLLESTPSPEALLAAVDLLGFEATRRLSDEHRSSMGQFMTPAPVAAMLAAMFGDLPKEIRLLDAGAGAGSLTAATVAELCRRPKKQRVKKIHVVTYEMDPVLATQLRETLQLCERVARAAGIIFTSELRARDFIDAAADQVAAGLFAAGATQFDAAILNPPYRKINSDSETRLRLRSVGIETSNLYAAFVWLAVKMLKSGGELVAITPRSFANGPYFKPFRLMLASTASFRRVHVFESRKRAFAGDDVLQENLIYHLVKSTDRGRVVITSSSGPEDCDTTIREISHNQLIRDDDPDAFVHVVPDEVGGQIGDRMRSLSHSLEELDVQVSTGRTVEFRTRDRIHQDPATPKSVPLIYPHHFKDGFVSWPAAASRINAQTRRGPDDDDLLLAGYYVLVKRFSAKEERRRIVAAIFDPSRVKTELVAFENHLNYFHRSGRGLPENLAKGLALFLNSTAVDAYFRQFNGHTQVNARDLKSIRYPSHAQLEAVGELVNSELPSQQEIDHIVTGRLLAMAKGEEDPFQAKQKIDEALAILTAVKAPKAQINERSALTLLSLLDVRPASSWADAADPRRGITEMMDWFRDHYGKNYAPNTRETVRRFTIHQFEAMALVLKNPDEPTRPPNSPNNVYQIEPGALELIRSYGTDAWEKKLTVYLDSMEGVNKLREQSRSLSRIDVTLPNGEKVELTAGGQNVLVKEIIEQFCPRYTPGGHVVYLGDAGKKYRHFDEDYLEELGVTIDEHGQMPDVVVHFREKNWLILIEAVTSHGPVNLLRHNQLKNLFRGSKAGLVFVSTFLDRRAMKEYLGEISWETEVWCADSPDHLIHFNGERFLGPYEK